MEGEQKIDRVISRNTRQARERPMSKGSPPLLYLHFAAQVIYLSLYATLYELAPLAAPVCLSVYAPSLTFCKKIVINSLSEKKERGERRRMLVMRKEQGGKQTV